MINDLSKDFFYCSPDILGTILMLLLLLSVPQQPPIQSSVQTGGIQLRRPQPAGRAPHRKQPCELYCRWSFSWPVQPADAVSLNAKVSYKTLCKTFQFLI